MVVLDEPTRLDRSPRRPSAGGRSARLAALTAGDRRLTFAELDRARTRSPARSRRRRRAGDRAGYLGKNSLEFFELLFGASKVGAVTVPVNWRLAAPRSSRSSTTRHRRARRRRRTRRGDRAGRRRAGLGRPPSSSLGLEGELRGPSPGRDQSARDGPRIRGACRLPTMSPSGCTRPGRRDGRRVRCSRTATCGACSPRRRDRGFAADSVNLVALPNFHVGGVGGARRPVRRRLLDRAARVRRRRRA